MPTAPLLDPAFLPLSRRGSYLAVSHVGPDHVNGQEGPPGVYLRTLHGFSLHGTPRCALRFTPVLGGRDVPEKKTSLTLTPAVFSQRVDSRRHVDFTFAARETLRVRGSGGLSLRLDAAAGSYNYAREAGPGLWELNLVTHKLQLMLRLRRGVATMDSPWGEYGASHLVFHVEPDASGAWEIELHEFVAGWKPVDDPRDFDACARAVDAEFTAWRDALPAVPPALARTRQLAAYVMWSCLVAPCGHLRRETMYMSNNRMPAVWAWDHCFNAIALAGSHPALAWDQWAVIFDFQTPAGSLPDVASDSDFITNFVKPPVHGWALREMRRHLRLSPAQKRHALAVLGRWTRWWLDYRDDDFDGLPQYNHGNDSGWDNATVFAHGTPVEGPDLATFLILQMDECAILADELGRPAAARRWRRDADDLTARLLAHSWRGDRFVAPRSGDHAIAPASDSLIPFMPLLLGARLPAAIRQTLVAGLRRPGRLLTAHGLATESPKSPLYQPDGYWRGPVWAPSTQLLVSALRGVGETTLAAEIARRFCRTCAKSGLAENFDALTGRGLREPAHTWTASGFLTLAATSAARATSGR